MTRNHIFLVASLLLLCFALTGRGWEGNAQLHTLSEIVATMLALIVGTIALVRFYTKKNNTYLFVGAGFIGAALLDGYHGTVTSTFMYALLPSPLPSLSPWSWNASRTFLALMMLLSIWACNREKALKDTGRIGEGAVYFAVGALTALSFIFFAYVPLPRAYYPELFFGRPAELIPAALFLLAALGFLKKEDWRQDPFENTMVLSLIVGFMGQAVFMSRSFALFDTMFDAAHLLKIVSYGTVLVGLLVNTYHMHGEVDRQNEQHRQAQEELTQIIEDLAEAKSASEIQAAKLAEVNAELEQFSYAASHDLKEPVRNLVSYSTLLREDLGDDLSDEVAMDLEYISSAAKRMGNLVDDLLSLSKVGRSSMKQEPVLIEDCVAESLEALRSRILESGAHVEWDQLPEVTGDAFLLTQLYQNLLGNAMKFTENGSPLIHLTAERGGDGWTLGVRDNGIGINPEYAEQIFTPFKRLHGITEFEGTGIGLALCRKTIERHGGEIWVESEPGKGAHFKFTLPASSGDHG